MPFKVNSLNVMPSGSNQKILSDIELEIADGCVTLLIGASGSGKTTLLECLAGLAAPTEGEVLLDGVRLDNNRRGAVVARRIGMMFQFPERQLYASSVAKEFHFALKPLRLPTALAMRLRDGALAAFGMDANIVHEAPLTLSGGQRRRVAMAIGLARQPDWLLLDEPTAGLDAVATALFTEAIRQHLARLRDQGRGGIVIATHDLDALLPIADQVVMLQAGRVIDACKPALLFQNPERLRAADIGLSPELETILALRGTGLTFDAGPLPATDVADVIAANANRQAHAQASQDARPNLTKVTERRESVATLSPEENIVAEGQTTGDQTITGHAITGRAPAGQTARGQTTTGLTAEGQAAVDTLTATKSFAEKLDARSKLLFSTCVCVGIFVQTTWIGISIAILVAFLSVRAARLSLMSFFKTLRPLLVLAGLSILFAGISFHHGTHWWNVGWNTAGFWFAVRRMTILLSILGIGSALSTSTSQLQFRRSLSQLLTPLAKFGLPVESISLGCSLVLRFIPVVLREARHCIKAAQAAGRPTRHGRLRLRDVPAIIIPLVLTMLRFGEDVSLAMESRGFQLKSKQIQMEGCRWHTRDTLIAFFGGLILLGFLVLG